MSPIDGEASLFQAYCAGFALSREGYNAEYGGPDEEWLRVKFERDVLGKPSPGRCREGRRVEDMIARMIGTNVPVCTRPKGHDGLHVYGAYEWNS